jgi:hypothetical protein
MVDDEIWSVPAVAKTSVESVGPPVADAYEDGMIGRASMSLTKESIIELSCTFGDC